MGKLSYRNTSKLELVNSLYIAQINTESFNLDQISDYDYKPLSAYPFIKFDLSFLNLMLEYFSLLFTENIAKFQLSSFLNSFNALICCAIILLVHSVCGGIL